MGVRIRKLVHRVAASTVTGELRLLRLLRLMVAMVVGLTTWQRGKDIVTLSIEHVVVATSSRPLVISNKWALHLLLNNHLPILLILLGIPLSSNLGK